MPKAFLETGEHRGFVTGLDIDNTAGEQARLRQGGSEKILPGDAPQHFAFGARSNAGRKEGGRGAINRAITATGNLMQGTKRQPASRQDLVDPGNAEWQGRAGARRPAFEACDSLTKLSDSRAGGRLTHERDTLKLTSQWISGVICSLFVLFGA